MQPFAAAVVSDSDGNRIGRLLSITDDAKFLSVLTDQSFIIQIRIGNGSLDTFVGNLMFESVDCSGEPYSSTASGFVTVAYDLAGLAKLFYTAKDSLPTELLAVSSMSGAEGCQPFGGFFGYVWPVWPNDPAITGVSNSAYSVPLRID